MEELEPTGCSLSWQKRCAEQELEVADQSLHMLWDRILIVQAVAAVEVEFDVLGRIRWEVLRGYPWVVDSLPSLAVRGCPYNP